MQQSSFSLAFLFVYFTLSAQQYQYMYGSSGADSMNGLVECADGSMLVVGHSDGFSGGQDDLVLFKTDQYGNPISVKAWGGEGTDAFDEINPGPNNTFYFCGSSSSYSSDGDFDAFYGLMDEAGEMIWAKRIGQNGMEQSRKIIMTSDGGFLLTGISNSFNENGDVDYFLLKGNEEGETDWFKVVGANEYEVSVSCAEDTINGGYFVWGHCTGEFTEQYDALLSKFDENGTLLWSKTYSANANELAWDMLMLEDGGIILCGDTGSQGAGFTDIYIIEVDSDGNVQWASTYGAYSNDHATNITKLDNDMMAITGLSSSFGSGGLDMMLLSLDRSGNMKVNGAYGGDNKEVSFEAIHTQDHGLAICGYSRSFGEGFNTGMVCKLDINGQMGCNQHFTNSFERNDFDLLSTDVILSEKLDEMNTLDVTFEVLDVNEALAEKICSDQPLELEGINNETNNFTDVAQNNTNTLPNLQQDRVGSILIFPNPASEAVKVQWPALADEALLVSLVGMDGKTIKSAVFSFEESGFYQAEVSLIDVQAGVYLLELSSNDIQVTKQILVQ